MKAKHFLIGITTGLLLCSGCEKENPYWEIVEKNIVVPSYYQYCYIQVQNSRLSLTVVVDAAAADWCTVDEIDYSGSVRDGIGGVEIGLALESNLMAEPRVAIVTISKDGRSEVVTITQEASAATISVDHTMIELDCTAGTYTIPVTSNTSWTAAVEVSAAWCTLTTASGKGNGTVTVSAPQAIFKRQATIFVNAGTLRDSVIIFQHGEPVYDSGVNIGGVIWATRNVNDFGTFASPYENGKFYQFNRVVAYTSTDPLSPEWDDTLPEYGGWFLINDPCPEGWRVPSQSEFQRLAASGWRWVTAEEDGPGTWFGPGAQTASLYPTVPDDAVFFPAAGARITSDGHLLSIQDKLYQWIGENGCYWSNEDKGVTSPPMLFGAGVDTAGGRGWWSKRMALSVRCVKK
ncbi:MAG: hypothetical protein LBD52_02795 [Prevotellaceae bacterium]|jgi:uncharacterized protein (TIGR02145 family)|nr:hypothetical protein [Prevotellaceae bacterium]